MIRMCTIYAWTSGDSVLRGKLRVPIAGSSLALYTSKSTYLRRLFMVECTYTVLLAALILPYCVLSTIAPSIDIRKRFGHYISFSFSNVYDKPIPSTPTHVLLQFPALASP